MADADAKDAWQEGFDAPLGAEMPYRNGTSRGENWKWGHAERWGWVDALTPAQAAGLAAGTHVVVPVEATDDMLDVGGGATTRNLLRSFYRKMVQRATAQKEG